MSDQHTYEQAPPVPPGAPAGGPSGPRASFGRRFVAWLLDAVILAVVQVVLIEIFAADTAVRVLSAVIGIIYYVTLEGGPRGQTVGKMALGIRVYDFRQGGPIGYGRALIRDLSRILSAIPLFLGYFWMLWDREKQTWHDKLSGSVVVPVADYPV